MSHGASQSSSSSGMNVPALSLIAVIGAILTYVTVVGVQAYYDAAVHEEEQAKLIAPEYEPLRELEEQVKANLTNDVGWVDKDAGIVHVSIDQGKAAVIEQFGQ